VESLTAGQIVIQTDMKDLCTQQEVQQVKDDVLKIKTQAGVWGGIVGFAAGIAAGLIQWFIKGGS
jgi:hypothetical protein